MNKDQKIQELSLLQQNLANISAQKQQFVSQLSEFDAALKALEKTDKSYKIIGNIMVSSTKEDLKKDIAKKQEIVNIRIKSFEKQEEKLKEKAETMQKEIISEIEKKRWRIK